MDLSIIIPTYNEKENIEILIPRIEENLKNNNINGEIIIVDDDSPDKTSEEVEKLNKKYRNINLVLRKNRKGIASAWFEGFDAAKGKYVACMDADLCHSPEDLMRMYKEIHNHDIVIGSRYLIKGKKMRGKSILATYASYHVQFLTKLVTGLNGKDITHSFRIFRKDVFNNIKNKLNSKGNVFLVEFLYRAVKKGYNYHEVPIDYGARKYGKTKLNFFSQTIRFLYKIIMLRLGF